MNLPVKFCMYKIKIQADFADKHNNIFFTQTQHCYYTISSRSMDISIRNQSNRSSHHIISVVQSSIKYTINQCIRLFGAVRLLCDLVFWGIRDSSISDKLVELVRTRAPPINYLFRYDVWQSHTLNWNIVSCIEYWVRLRSMLSLWLMFLLFLLLHVYFHGVNEFLQIVCSTCYDFAITAICESSN